MHSNTLSSRAQVLSRVEKDHCWRIGWDESRSQLRWEQIAAVAQKRTRSAPCHAVTWAHVPRVLFLPVQTSSRKEVGVNTGRVSAALLLCLLQSGAFDSLVPQNSSWTPFDAFILTRVQGLPSVLYGVSRPEPYVMLPLQSSCLENSMDRGAWRAIQSTGSQSRTRPSA